MGKVAAAELNLYLCVKRLLLMLVHARGALERKIFFCSLKDKFSPSHFLEAKIPGEVDKQSEGRFHVTKAQDQALRNTRQESTGIQSTPRTCSDSGESRAMWGPEQCQA